MMQGRFLLLICTSCILECTRSWAPATITQSSTRVVAPAAGPFLLAMANTASSIPYPRAAVSVAVRCECENEVYYLLVQRGKDPNEGRWSFPGGKLEIGETAMQGGRRELQEETKFVGQEELRWYPETIATNDSILVTPDGTPDYHFLIAVCFAELEKVEALPVVQACDDAANARWWKSKDLVEKDVDVTPGLIERIERTEFLYQREVLL